MSHKMPIASIFFEGDFRLQVLQALSIDRLYDLSGLTEYTVILNGEDNAALRSRFTSALRGRVSEELWRKLRLIEWSDLFGDEPRAGVKDQQVIKLGLSGRYETEYYLLLDAKNHFVTPATASIFFQGGKPIAPLGPVTDYWMRFLEPSLEAMGAGVQRPRIKMLPSITPYVIVTQEARNAVSYIEQKYASPWPRAMGMLGRATEFLLYYAHLVKNDKVSLYENLPLPGQTLFTVWPQAEDVILAKVRECASGDAPIFGLHRARLPQLNDRQKLAIGDMWSQHLLGEWESSEWFLTT